MGLEVLLTKIPWFKLLTAVPPIVRTARELMQAAQKPAPQQALAEGEPDVRQRIARLEEIEKKQSVLVQKMSEQLQAATESLQILSVRLQAVFLLALFAFLLAATALILLLK